MAETSPSEGRSEPENVTDAPLPPGPDGLPLLGNTLSIAGNTFGFYDELAEYGDVVTYTVAGQRFVTLLHPDHVERALLHDFETFRKWSGEEFGIDLAPDGLLFAEGEQWRRQRTSIQGAFTLDRIESYTDAMVEYAGRTVDGWDDGETVAVDRAFSRLTLRILARSLFDLDIGDDEGVVTRTADVLNERADARNLQVFLPQWVPTPLNRRFERAMADMEVLVADLIEERRADPDEYDDLLSLLLRVEDDDGRRLSHEELVDNVVTFLFAGHDTTSLALTYTFLLLSTHPEARERLDREHDAVLGGSPPELDDLDDLAYTERVIKESLRLYPPAYVLFRQAAADVEVGGYRIPEGTIVTLPQFRLHVDARFWDAPDEFRPERWTDEMEAELPDYAYFPFGGGPRHCIGMRFAMTELKHLVPTIAQRVDFDLLSDPEPERQASVTLRPADPVEMRVRKR
ncbi:MAG TPA: cytochrome P450 [Halobacteriales archaeon]|nr:cytochrome P450 [Halobacteriales archaeon]